MWAEVAYIWYATRESRGGFKGCPVNRVPAHIYNSKERWHKRETEPTKQNGTEQNKMKWSEMKWNPCLSRCLVRECGEEVGEEELDRVFLVFRVLSDPSWEIEDAYGQDDGPEQFFSYRFSQLQGSAAEV